MSRVHHKAPSKPDRAKELRNFLGLNGQKAIASKFLSGEIRHNQAISLLSQTSSEGLLWAGEIALENAQLVRSKASILDNLQKAKLMLMRAEAIRLHTNKGRVDHVVARAQLQSLHLPVYGCLALEHSLPSQQVAEKTYPRTLQVGMALAKEYEQTSNNTPEELELRKDMSGTLGEIAVLTLLERFALNIGSDSWYPFLAYFSEDRRNRHGSTIGRGWNISVFTDLDEHQIDQCYRVQVKTILAHHAYSLPMSEGISLVAINPDLKINLSDRQQLSSQIIEECNQELTGESQYSAGLEQRTEKLLKIMDSV